MKKYLLLIGLVFCTGIATAQTFQRSNKAPAFFMPANAMNKPQPRQQQQRQALPPQQVRQQAQPQPQKPKQPVAAEVKQTQPKNEPPKNQAAAKTDSPNKPKPIVATAKNKNTPPPQQTAANNKPLPFKQKNIGHLMGIKQPSKTDTIPPTKPEETTPAPEPRNIFEQIINEYEQDLKLISKKQKVRNLRLQKALSNFQDKDIPF